MSDEKETSVKLVEGSPKPIYQQDDAEATGTIIKTDEGLRVHDSTQNPQGPSPQVPAQNWKVSNPAAVEATHDELKAHGLNPDGSAIIHKKKVKVEVPAANPKTKTVTGTLVTDESNTIPPHVETKS